MPDVNSREEKMIALIAGDMPPKIDVNPPVSALKKATNAQILTIALAAEETDSVNTAKIGG